MKRSRSKYRPRSKQKVYGGWIVDKAKYQEYFREKKKVEIGHEHSKIERGS